VFLVLLGLLFPAVFDGAYFKSMWLCTIKQDQRVLWQTHAQIVAAGFAAAGVIAATTVATTATAADVGGGCAGRRPC
jgi:hypothetical protein